VSGCSWLCGKPIQSNYEKPYITFDEPKPLTMERVNFVIVTKDNSQKKFAEMEKDRKDPVVFGLSDSDYAALARNMEAIQGQILLYKKVIQSYKDYYKPTEESKTE